MAYASWSVVFGEQPSAAKWNILGTNDASFNDGTGIGNNVIGSSQLKAAQSNSTPGSISSINTSYVTGATLSLTAGTYFLLARARATTSVAQSTTFTAEIYNSTGTAILDATYSTSEYVSGTQTANMSMVNVTPATLSTTSSIIARYKVDDGSGSSGVNEIILIAIPIGV